MLPSSIVFTLQVIAWWLYSNSLALGQVFGAMWGVYRPTGYLNSPFSLLHSRILIYCRIILPVSFSFNNCMVLVYLTTYKPKLLTLYIESPFISSHVLSFCRLQFKHNNGTIGHTSRFSVLQIFNQWKYWKELVNLNNTVFNYFKHTVLPYSKSSVFIPDSDNMELVIYLTSGLNNPNPTYQPQHHCTTAFI